MNPLEVSAVKAEDAESVRALLDSLLDHCIATGASDLHLTSHRPPYVRLHGELQPMDEIGVLPPTVIESISRSITPDLQAIQHTGSIDGAMSASSGARFRFNIFRRQGTLSISLRRLEDSLHSLAALGLPDILYDVCTLSYGLVVVAGPTGSGKSTTLAALIDRINRERAAHIVTIEDPIEYLHEPIKSLVNQRQIGSDASSFHDALVASLRQDPDVILVGEVRDLNTIRTAISAAETGHLVFTTVHAGDCIGAIERLISVFPADEQVGVRKQLALVLRWIVTQQLIVADGARVERNGAEVGIMSRRRVIAAEILRNTGAVANLVATAKSNQILSAMEAGGSLGMQTMEHDLARLWVGGHLSENTAMTLARNPSILRERAQLLRQQGKTNSVFRTPTGGVE